MKILLSHVSAFCDIRPVLNNFSLKQLAHHYSIHTAEVEEIETYDMIENVAVAKVLSVQPHPNSDHLNLVRLFCGTLWEKHIVCGAENVRNAQYVAVALEWAVLPWDFIIKKSIIRGEESEGMICSIDELWLSTERAEGILPLESVWDTDFLERHIGKPFFSLLLPIPGIHQPTHHIPLSDVAFTIDNKFITNRPDLFGVEWNAREFWALFDRYGFHPYQKTLPQNHTQKNMDVQIQTPKVLAYHLLAFQNVSVQKSAFNGISLLLNRSGITPKYNLVDITNFIMTELGQPLHVFDTDKIEGNICVREAKTGEKILALDGKEYLLESGDIVIADGAKVLAIAGIIGGQFSAVSETTKNVCFESACFDSASIRLTAQRLGIRTDASTRYEKSLDPLLTKKVLPRIVDLLDYYQQPYIANGYFAYLPQTGVKQISIQCSTQKINNKLGTKLHFAEMEQILLSLGFCMDNRQDDAVWTQGTTVSDFLLHVPSWRATKDVNIWQDIAEEVGRIYGYKNILPVPIPGLFTITPKNNDWSLRKQIQNYLGDQWLFEVYNYSFANQTSDAKIGLADMQNAVQIQNAFSENDTHLCRSLFGRLFANAEENIKTKPSFGLYETDKIFHKNGPNDFSETRSLAGVFVNVDLPQVKAILDGFFATILQNQSVEAQQWTDHFIFHSGKSGTYTLNNTELAIFWYAHPQIVANFNLQNHSVIAFQVHFPLLLNLSRSASFAFSEPSKYPSITRELNFVMEEKLPVQQIIRQIIAVDPAIIGNVLVQDTYRDTVKVGEGNKSVTFSFTLNNSQKTITDEEALDLQNAVIAQLQSQNIHLRDK